MTKLLPERLRTAFKSMLTQNLGPAESAFAVWLGIIVGCTPLFGFHFFICLGLATLLRLNLVIAYGAAHISTPPLAPFVGFACVQAGAWLRTGHWAFTSLAAARAQPLAKVAEDFFLDWLLGGLALGTATGGLLALLVFVVLLLRAPTVLRLAAKRYQRAAPSFRWYAWFKYRMDPCYSAALEHLSREAQLLDLGGGIGMLAALREASGHRGLTTIIEWDEAKAACARQMTVATVLCGDAWKVPLPTADAIALIDVLHYRDAASQRALLGRAKAHLQPGGVLLVREHDAASGAPITRWFERTAVRLGWNRAQGVYFRPASEIAAELAEGDFTVEALAVSGSTHPGNVLFVARGPSPLTGGAAASVAR